MRRIPDTSRETLYFRLWSEKDKRTLYYGKSRRSAEDIRDELRRGGFRGVLHVRVIRKWSEPEVIT